MTQGRRRTEIPVVVVVKGVLPVDSPGLGHGVIPLYFQIGILLYVYHEVTHVLGKLGIAPGGLLIDEPAVKAVVFSHFDELVRNREGGSVLLHKVPHPLYLTSVGRGWQEDGSVDRDTISVSGVYYPGIRGQYESLT